MCEEVVSVTSILRLLNIVNSTHKKSDL